MNTTTIELHEMDHGVDAMMLWRWRQADQHDIRTGMPVGFGKLTSRHFSPRGWMSFNKRKLS